MGRVDEALRRAAEAARQGAAVDRAGATVVQVPATTLARPAFDEDVPAFPAEAPDEPGPAVAPAAPPAVPVAARSQAPAGEGRLTPSAAESASGRAFDLIDPSYARKVVIDDAIVPASREQYRRLAAALHQSQAEHGTRVIMVASAVVGEGKTLTASNLALTLSESYHRSVLLIDADLRRPSVHKVFRTQGSPGLTEGLTAPVDQKLPLHQITPRLTILPAGQPNADPMAGLTSSRMRRLIDEARQAFDWVVIDTPPVGLLTDASLLAAMVDGTLLVVHAGSTPYELVKRAVDTIGPERILGTVLNRAAQPVHEKGYYGAYEQYSAPITVGKSLR
jgi:capsular exopolysaccharide synthesis family protein